MSYKEYKEFKQQQKQGQLAKPKMEFSKKILVFSYLAAGMTFSYAMWIQYMMMVRDFHGDVGIVIALLAGAGAMITSGQGFYSWKARSENAAKIAANPDYLRTSNEPYYEHEREEEII